VLEARISSSRGSMYFAAVDAASPNLRLLRRHVRRFAEDASGERVLVDLHVSAAEAAAPRVRSWVAELAAAGVHITERR